jgi:5-oxoprolinase (ATP-hydrolysing)
VHDTVRPTGGRWHDAALYVRDALLAGDTIDGPAIIAERNGTTVVEPAGARR